MGDRLSLSLLLYLNSDIPDMDEELYLDGAGLAEYFDDICQLCSDLNIPPISDFFSITDEDYENVSVDSDMHEPSLSIIERWYSASSGFDTVCGIIDFFSKNTEHVLSKEDILNELFICKKILEEARSNDIKFHFSMDY